MNNHKSVKETEISSQAESLPPASMSKAICSSNSRGLPWHVG